MLCKVQKNRRYKMAKTNKEKNKVFPFMKTDARMYANWAY